MGSQRRVLPRCAEQSCCTDSTTGSRGREQLHAVALAVLGKAASYTLRHGPTIVDRILITRSQRQLTDRTPTMDDSRSATLPVLPTATGGCATATGWGT